MHEIKMANMWLKKSKNTSPSGTGESQLEQTIPQRVVEIYKAYIGANALILSCWYQELSKLK